MKFGFRDSGRFPIMRALFFSGAVFCALSLFSCKDDPDSYPPIEERDRVQGVVFDVDFSRYDSRRQIAGQGAFGFGYDSCGRMDSIGGQGWFRNAERGVFLQVRAEGALSYRENGVLGLLDAEVSRSEGNPPESVQAEVEMLSGEDGAVREVTYEAGGEIRGSYLYYGAGNRLSVSADKQPGGLSKEFRWKDGNIDRIKEIGPKDAMRIDVKYSTLLNETNLDFAYLVQLLSCQHKTASDLLGVLGFYGQMSRNLPSSLRMGVNVDYDYDALGRLSSARILVRRVGKPPVEAGTVSLRY